MTRHPQGAIQPALGFTLPELLIAIVIMGAVLGTLISVLAGQQRFYARTGDLIDMRSTLRQTLAALPADLRGVSPPGGDIYAISDSSIEFRAVTGSSVACVIPVVGGTAVIIPPTTLAQGNTLTTWLAQPQVGDSVLIYSEGPLVGSADDFWTRRAITAIVAAAGVCPAATGFTTAADAAQLGYTLTLATGLDNRTVVGAPIRFFRRVKYELYPAADQRWYLGYRDCLSTRATPCDNLQPLSGPYRPRSAAAGQSGLSLSYFDSTGAVTANPLLIARIGLIARGQTRLHTDGVVGRDSDRDSITVNIGVRNRP